jgi:hypothetical protein
MPVCGGSKIHMLSGSLDFDPSTCTTDNCKQLSFQMFYATPDSNWGSDAPCAIVNITVNSAPIAEDPLNYNVILNANGYNTCRLQETKRLVEKNYILTM